ncbi:acetate/propionate family kinase [Ideonella sp. 4Y11]|uniref:Acetate kinase n=1 Tax=Ideonella aquatica TaxID=2824119 RepID=A0A941BM97_9BURK|nr:acetate/propionate family kinase [Ideonella aquatica]MBQ0960599.1 acetate/propionate family kinase [Ideonella aquatica]
MTDAVLAVNAGSSSLKFGLYPRQGAALWTGQIEGLEAAGDTAFDNALQRLLHDCTQRGARLVAVAHRIVHGGDDFVAPCRLDAAALRRLRRLEPLAPLHQPHNLDGVAAFLQARPQLPQIGCFDTAFHATLPALERLLPIERTLAAQGLRRYGFHGLSYHYLAQTLPQHSARAGGRVLLAHLGNGASLCALQGGRSVATTMGFSALEGLMMGTRSGSLDPGVLLHLLRQGWSADALEDLLYRRSGLKGVSGLSADMRTLRASAEPAAAQAIALFTHRVLREAGALAALLGGLDAIAFTGGIGEHDARLRADVLTGLAHLGVRHDAAANHAATGDAVRPLHTADSAVEVWVVPTDEGRVAAQSAFDLLEPR